MSHEPYLDELERVLPEPIKPADTSGLISLSTCNNYCPVEGEDTCPTPSTGGAEYVCVNFPPAP